MTDDEIKQMAHDTFWSLNFQSLVAEQERTIERAIREAVRLAYLRAAEKVCSSCSEGEPVERGFGDEWQHKNMLCRASGIRKLAEGLEVNQVVE